MWRAPCSFSATRVTSSCALAATVSGGSPTKSKTGSNPGKPASGQPQFVKEDFAAFSADVNALIGELENTDSFSGAVDLAMSYLTSKTSFSIAQQIMHIDCETAVRVLLDCEILGCVMALRDSQEYAELMDKFQLFVETKQEGGPATGTIADYRLQEEQFGAFEHPCAIPVEAKGPNILVPELVRIGKPAHQLRCEMDATRETGNQSGRPAKRRQFGVLCDEKHMFLFYTTTSEGRMHCKVIQEGNQRSRLSTFMLAILISLSFDPRFFNLDGGGGEDEGGVAGEDEGASADGGSDAGEDEGARGGDNNESDGGELPPPPDNETSDEKTPPKGSGNKEYVGGSGVALEECLLKMRDAHLPDEEETRAQRILQFALRYSPQGPPCLGSHPFGEP